MTLIIFIIILGVLVFVHELGHFLAAKKAGVYVEEFGFGYPPRALVLGRKWGTLFSINWIPFGGFVKIFGENYEEAESLELKADSNEKKDPKTLSFVNVSKRWQATILVAGVTFNILFAWFLFSIGFMMGLPTPVENDFGAEVKNASLTVVQVMEDSPAFDAGIKTGDKIESIYSTTLGTIESPTPESLSNFINQNTGEVILDIDRGGDNFELTVLPEDGLVEDRKAIGINMDMVGIMSLPLHSAIYEGGRITLRIIYLTTAGLFDLVKSAFVGEADISEISGPVGIVGLVGDASRLGFVYLITFTSLISINLAVINMVPFPALDGGRLLFVIIEAITGRPINKKFALVANTVGFAILIGLMLIVTYRDVLKLF